MELANPAVGLNVQLVAQKYAFKAAAATLKLYETFVRATANTASGDFTLTLPPVSQAQGMLFYIYVTIANTKTVTVEDNSGDAAMTDLDMDADADNVLLFSTGVEWIQLFNGIA